MRNFIFFLLIILTSCHDKTKIPGDYITPEENVIATDCNGVRKRIPVRSNGDWTIDDTPPWCIALKAAGDGEDFLEIDILPNDTETLRETTIVLTLGRTSALIRVTQTGLEPEDPLQWHTFAFNTLTDQQYAVLPDNSRNYSLAARQFFINPAFAGEVFPGHIIDRHTNTRSLTGHDRFTYRPVQLSALVNGTFFGQELIPSFDGFREFVQPILDELPAQSGAFHYSSPMRYHSYRHLHLLGVGNMGLSLDEVLTGKPYTAKEMNKRTGMIYNYSSELFTVLMDQPEKLIEEEVTGKELSDMLYIQSITYGSTALMLVESDFEFKAAKGVVQKIIRSERLTDQEAAIGEELDVCYLRFDRDGILKTARGGRDLIGRFAGEIATLEIVPLSFTTNRLADHTVGELQIVFLLP